MTTSPSSQALEGRIVPTLVSPSPEAVQGLTDADSCRIAQALHHARSPNTRATYAYAWSRFTAWAQGRGAPPLPASPERVAAYLTELADTHGLSVATIRLHRFAIGAVHRNAGLDDPTAHEGVRRVLSGLARANARPQRQARGLTAGALAAIRATARIPRRSQGRAGRLETAGVAERRGLVDIALASTLRDGLLRRSEAAALLWGDVELLADGSGRLHLRQSKGDQEGLGVVLYLGSDAVRDLRAIRPAEGLIDARAPVFGLSPSQVGRRLRAAAQAAGLGDGFTAHSGRVGMAQDLAATGAELPELMTAGRWRTSAMVARYTAAQSAGRGAVARYYGHRNGAAHPDPDST